MNKPNITITITKEAAGYSATTLVNNRFVATEADTFDLLKLNILEVVNLSFEAEGWAYGIGEIGFVYDVQSFFDFYTVINIEALSERIGINQSLLADYIAGIKKPSAPQTKRIVQGVQQIGKELAEISIEY